MAIKKRKKEKKVNPEYTRYRKKIFN